MKVNISLVDLLLLRMTQAVAITLDSNNAAAGVPWRFWRANQAGSNPCSASRAGCSAWINVQPLSAPSALTAAKAAIHTRSEEQTSELQSLMSISYAVFCLKKKKDTITVTRNKKQE